MAEKGDAERSLDTIREVDKNEGKYANERESVFGREESESGGEREKFGCVDVKEIKETGGGEGRINIEVDIEVKNEQGEKDRNEPRGNYCEKNVNCN